MGKGDKRALQGGGDGDGRATQGEPKKVKTTPQTGLTPSYEGAIEDLRDRREKLNKEGERLEGVVTNITQNLQTCKRKHVADKRALDRAEDDMGPKIAEATEAEKTSANLKTKLEEERAELRKLRDQIADAQKKIAMRTENINRLKDDQTKVNILKREAADTKREAEKKRSVVEESLSKVSKLQKDLDTAQQRLKENREFRRALNTRFINEALKNADPVIADFVRDIATTAKKVTETNQLLLQENKELMKEKKELEKKLEGQDGQQ